MIRPIRIRDGTEYWTVAIDDASDVQESSTPCAYGRRTIAVTRPPSATTGSGSGTDWLSEVSDGSGKCSN
ncbi:hypothetical protein C9J85_01205 [Haloferax sp. wsp5]|nr:hypothetical protein C9J85_01205 [Haloferax sp. wsp5]